MLRRTLPQVLPVLATLLALTAPLPVVAQSPAPPAKMLSLDVSQGDLSAVVQTLERQMGLKAQLRSAQTPFHPVNVNLSDEPLPKVLQVIADSAGAKLTRHADGSYLFGPEDGVVIPIPASAPGPLPVQAIVSTAPGPRQVQVVASFALADAEDVDSLGIQPDSISLPAAPGSEERRLQYATGNPVALLLQALKPTHAVISSAILTSNNVPADCWINTEVPRGSEQRVPDTIQSSSVRRAMRFPPFRSHVTLTARINDDGTVTLNFTAQVGGTSSPSISTTRTVVSGDTLVLVGWQVQDDGTFTPGIPPVSPPHTRGKHSEDEELLIFLTPTIVGESTDSGRNLTP